MFDVIIVGSGPAGLTASIYTTRAGLKTLILAGSVWGGQLQLTTDVENFPGFPDGIQGPELMSQMRKQAEKFGATIIDKDMGPVDFSQMSGGPFTVSADGKEYQGRALLIATGATSKTLDIPGEDKLRGHGVSYCATCDGAFFKGKRVIVVGGGDSAMEEALFLTHFGDTVVIVHRRENFKASKIMLDRVKSNPKIQLLTNKQILEIEGETSVSGIKVKDTVTGEESEIDANGVFVAIGHSPNSSIFKGIELTDRGYVQREQHGTRTNIEGIFVSGDVEDDHYRQAVTAAGFGAQAAIDIEKWLASRE